LLFKDLQAVGGGISAVYPVSELLVSALDERLKNKEAK